MSLTPRVRLSLTCSPLARPNHFTGNALDCKERLSSQPFGFIDPFSLWGQKCVDAFVDAIRPLNILSVVSAKSVQAFLTGSDFCQRSSGRLCAMVGEQTAYRSRSDRRGSGSV